MAKCKTTEELYLICYDFFVVFGKDKADKKIRAIKRRKNKAVRRKQGSNKFIIFEL